MSDQPTQEAITAVWRHESARLVAALTRMTRDLDLAEDLAQDALVAALEQWPDAAASRANPGAWLMAVAKRRAIDHFRRTDTLRRRTTELEHDLAGGEVPDLPRRSTTSRTTCCGWCSSAATRCCRPSRAPP